MTLTKAQEAALQHLRSTYVGPSEGEAEVVFNPPHLQYAVGMLYPAEAKGRQGPVSADDAVEPDVVLEEEQEDAGIPLAEEWRPSSVAMSFITTRPEVLCDVSGGTYAAISDDGPPRWQRSGFRFGGLRLSKDSPLHQLSAGGVPFEVGSRWRDYGKSRHLVTVHVRVRTESTDNDRSDIARMLFQIGLSVAPSTGGEFLEYDTSRAYEFDDESAELRLRFRNKKIYSVGHGMAADWEITGGKCGRVFLEPVPSFVVPAVETTGFEEGTAEAAALRLDHLATIDTAPDDVLKSLDAFVSAFSSWVGEQEARVVEFGQDVKVAQRIIERARIAVNRMQAGVDLLRDPGEDTLRAAFALGMAAMRLQMYQAAAAKTKGDVQEPAWRPFQLGFLLVSLASTVDESHDDRELVDLIWFPTGGGKTEAYLGLSAVEAFRRRLVHGIAGGGTAVITRYTLRLLTAQQFQRAASLICAMELLRLRDPRAKGMARFSIGLWIGNEATPGTRSEAKAALDRLHKAARPEDANKFQIESCPWCRTPLLPKSRTADLSSYGMRMVGKDVVIHCTDSTCDFHRELPVAVVDEVLYEQPPTILLATVDKFARLQFKPEARKLLGLGTQYRQPSLVIQDELHLLSGPLGTTVAVFDAVIQLLLSQGGTIPKIVASTATIRASDEQVRGLYGREVALYPPAGLDDDRTFFSRPVENGEGRLYVGLMPQALSQVSAVIAAVTPLIELPEVLTADPALDVGRDEYWTAVLYHNSLRELGRSGTLVVDDVNGRLKSRAERLKLPLRDVKGDRVLELTSRRGPEELPGDLRALGRSVDDDEPAVDVVLSSNMLSVGIDIPRLALMLMVGQPKTTSEYIQATSRVGRGSTRGIVVTLFRSNRARDRSHFETFRGYHEALYRSVEPTSVTPWSLASRKRSLAGALVALLRNALPPLSDNATKMDLDNPSMRSAVETLTDKFIRLAGRSEGFEENDTRNELWSYLREWDSRAKSARETHTTLQYERRKTTEESLLKRFDEPGQGWLVADSMRSVDPNVAVRVREPLEGGDNGTDHS